VKIIKNLAVEVVKELNCELIERINGMSDDNTIQLTFKERRRIIIALQYSNCIDLVLDKALGI